MRIIEFLSGQHAQARFLMERLSACDANQRAALRAELSSLLRRHMTVEEELVYRVFEEHEDLKDLVEECYRDHEDLREVLSELETSDVTSETYAELLFELRSTVGHHVTDEEGELFPKVEELWTQEQQEGVGRAVEIRFQHLARGEEARV